MIIGRFERQVTRLLPYVYKRRPRDIVATAPAWLSKETLSASERNGDNRAILWLSKN